MAENHWQSRQRVHRLMSSLRHLDRQAARNSRRIKKLSRDEPWSGVFLGAIENQKKLLETAETVRRLLRQELRKPALLSEVPGLLECRAPWMWTHCFRHAPSELSIIPTNARYAGDRDWAWTKQIDGK